MRKSGKTFRKVLRAVADASEGKCILYISQTTEHLEHARLLAERCVKFTSCVRIFYKGIEFTCAGGYVHFVSEAHFKLQEKKHMYKEQNINYVFDLT